MLVANTERDATITPASLLVMHQVFAASCWALPNMQCQICSAKYAVPKMQCQTCIAKHAMPNTRQVTPQWTGECVCLGTHCSHAHFSSGTCPTTPHALGVPILALAVRMPLHFEHQPTDLCLQPNMYDESHLAPHTVLNNKWNQPCC